MTKKGKIIKPPYTGNVPNNPLYDKSGKWNNDSPDSKKVLYCDHQLSERRIELIKRMVRGYNKNKTKIDQTEKQPPLSQSEKRRRKIEDLLSRSGKDGTKISWNGLQ